MPHPKTYRILSLDGGGSWALIQVKCLRKLFAETFNNPDPTGHEVLSKFDLVAANSGGSLVAAAMAENLRLSEIEKIFGDEQLRSKVFSRLSFFEKSLLSSVARIFKIGAKYATKRKYQALKDILPKISQIDLMHIPQHVAVNGDIKTQFLIIGYDYYRNRAEMFRTDCDSLASTSVIERKLKNLPATAKTPSDCLVSLVEAIHASSTAPVNYFNEPAAFKVNNKLKFYWDGGVTGNNNPVLAAVTEAICNREQYQIEHIQVLSIGTGSVSQLQYDEEIPVRYDELKAKHEAPGLIKDIQKMGTSILNDPPDTAAFIAYMILNSSMPAKPIDFIRMNPVLRPMMVNDTAGKHWDLPVGINKDEYVALNATDMDAVEDKEVSLIIKLCENWLGNSGVPNQAIRSDIALNCLIGHADFNAAKADFKSWFTLTN
ncbi:patatin-like phospholipase family protein [Pedobacter sp. MC2016-05]|uniref:patatin-like phospholipase family protein n=1 Tax=Pedobacter sp. MC2016-05 TaxID=2994474 RepID=UPI002245D2FD|nr:patatin-like phospholipase family protein [Pedobacter sp. MC2016-05]MCX2473961.1 patatin-like phospholipase family protein [Pedobacter sp. MC2016-05]